MTFLRVMKQTQNIKNTILNLTFGRTNENQVSVKLNRYSKGNWILSSKGVSHEWEILLDSGEGYKSILTMRATKKQAEKLAEKKMIEEWVYLNPLNN